MRRLNLDGDQQADLTVHGGVSKAVYLYPSEHYGYWRTELPGMDLPWGMFGENFTTEGAPISSSVFWPAVARVSILRRCGKERLVPEIPWN